jgi:hypothetical protein
MLKHLLPYKHNFSVFINNNYDRELLTDDHWTIAQSMFQFLQLFHSATVALSGVYYPTSSLMLHHMLKICKHLKEYENDDLLRPVVTRMKDVYLKYWKDIPMLYSLAFILDPRGKLKGFSRVLRLVGKLIGVDYSSYLTEVRAQLNIIYKRYDDKFGATKRKACPQAPTADKKNSA